MDIVERFISYAKIDTRSSEESETQPSTAKQFDLARVLERQLREMGVSAVRLTEHGYVYGRIPSNLSGEQDAKTPKLGLIAHMDTSPAASGTNVHPRLIEKYDGGDILLGHGKVLSPSTFPRLKEAEGQDLLVTDGSTLLGADDKAGVTEIMDLVQTLMSHPEIAHGEIEIGFTPDEEVGRGTEHFDVEGFGAEVAYTVDGGAIEEIEYENFNAASGVVRIHGVNVHPGSAKNKMINASLLAMEFDRLLPDERPANTEGYEGFYHLCGIEGDETECVMHYIIRDHDREKFEERKRIFARAGETIAKGLEGTAAGIETEMRDQYYNMKEKVEPYLYLIDVAKKAAAEVGVSMHESPIRGGTDGAQLSYKGLPCPNLPTGGENYHGIYEYLNVNAMKKIAEMLVHIVSGMVGRKEFT